MPGSDTGAFESALWSLLGPRKVQVLAFESFGQLWADDVAQHLSLDAEILSAPYGQLPDLSRVDKHSDIVFPWNGTTSGVCIKGLDFIAPDHDGLVLCDATSAAFCMDIDWSRLDVATFSFQKALGGEAGLGVLLLSPKAIDRLNEFQSNRPIAKIMRLKKGPLTDEAILGGDAINTYSFMVIEDYLDALNWAQDIGGLTALMNRCQDNFTIIDDWVKSRDWIDFVATDPATRSTTSVCLKFADPTICALSMADQALLSKQIVEAVENEGAGFDIGAYRHAPPGLRLWCGPTVDADDLRALLPWIDWAYHQAVSKP